MAPYFSAIQIIISVALMVVILLQAKGSGFSGAMSTDSSIFSSRRGLEKVLFNVTIVLAALFILVSLGAVLAS